ncbi:Gldg family protein [candidate division KSB1 bacterium]
MNFNLNINYEMIKALTRRDLRLYFFNPSGYVFITLFIFLSAAAAFWQERFFLNNLANLDQLSAFFPYLLLLFVPALTMGVWADEKKQGTDELLLTLPGTDLEIVFGKFMAVLGIYSASLLLSLVSNFFVLAILGSPDLGLMIGNYLGYWLIGAAFISVGMLASLLSPNATIAFILSGVMCAFFIVIKPIANIISDSFAGFVGSVQVFDSFGDFVRGVVSFSGLLYFVSLTGVMLYFNILLIGRRHWPQEADGYKMWMHHAARSVALVIIVISVNAIFGRAALRLDVTAEQLHSLSGQTKDLIEEISDDRPVLIQAYLSKEVPQSFVQTRESLIGFLKEIDAMAGSKVEVLLNDVEMFTEEARDAREKFGIFPREIADQSGARTNINRVFMGVAFTCGAEEEVIPFFDRGLPVEYELARSIRVVAKTERKKIGVLNTELQLFGGLDFNTMQSRPSWQVVDELRKQYEVVQISGDAPIVEEVIDGLLCVLPSSLPQEKMNNLMEYILAGHPTLLLIDALPVIDIGLAPLEQPGANRNPFMQQGAMPPEKGNIQEFFLELGVNWNPASIAWDTYNPHPELAQLPPEFIFLSAANPNARSFNEDHPASSELQEMVFLFPGTFAQYPDIRYKFIPLLRTSPLSGTLSYYDLVRRSFFGQPQIMQGLPHRPTPIEYPIAVHVVDTSAAADESVVSDGVNVIIISDVDFISSQFFDIRRAGIQTLNFDNISFFLNCMDMLVGDESFIELRKRRAKHRTLETVEARTRVYVEERLRKEEEAQTEAQVALQQANQRLNNKVAEIQQRVDLDEQTKRIMAQNIQEVENRKFATEQKNIESARDAKIDNSKEEMESQIRGIHSGIKSVAVLLPPIPVLVMGILIFLRRHRREKEGAAAQRRLRS